MKALVIVESPAKAKTISKYLGKDYIVKASLGHIKDLPKNKLGVDENNFNAEFNLLKDKKKIVNELKELANKVETIYLASDPDREGEAISFHIYQELNSKSARVYRILLQEITEKSVKNAIANPSTIDYRKVEAQFARRILDRLVGYKISPLLWEKIKRGLSAGRVQSVALRLICEREKEINNFIPQEYWHIDAKLLGSVPPEFTARLIKKDNKKIQIKNEQEALELIEELKKNKFILSDIVVKDRKRLPPPPFITSKLQQEAVQRLKMPVSKTMKIAQKLYEGIDLGGGERVGLITYMRTDSVRISNDALEEVRDFIKNQYSEEYLPETPIVYKNKNAAQDAHEAIRPTSVSRTPASIKNYLTKEEYLLYELIWQRFVASQMKEFKYKETKLIISNGAYLFEAKGYSPIFDGYRIIYKEEHLEDKEKEEKNHMADFQPVSLPILKKNEELKLIELKKEQKFTQPPPRYTEATLVKELEEKEIGRPSTYATILSILQDRNYVIKKEGRFYPTDLGMVVVDLLIKHFQDLLDVKFTANMEKNLDKIEEGAKNKLDVLKAFHASFKEELNLAKENMANIKQNGYPVDLKCPKCNEAVVKMWGKYGSYYRCTNKACNNHFNELTDNLATVNEKCPKCGSSLKVKNGKFGLFLSCERYPECKFTARYAGETKDYGKCPECGSNLVPRKSKYGNFIACSNYPNCKYIKGKEKIPCPKEGCDGKIVRRRSKKGKYFYGCSNYPKCDFISWTKP